MNKPTAKLRCRIRAWYIDLTYTLASGRTKEFTVGPFEWGEAKGRYETGAENGRWLKEGIGDR